MDELNETLGNGGLQAAVSGREKTAYSVWRKMQNKNVGFEQLSDIMAFRVVVDTVEQCYQALGIIHSHYPVVPGRFKDYISTPKPNNYSSLHTGVIGPQRQRIEMQIRTREMHEVAELGVAAHWVYKQARPAPREGSIAGCASCSTFSIMPPIPRIPRAHQARDVPGPGVLLHAQGRSDRAAARRDAGRTSPMRPFGDRRHLRRRQDQRPARAAAHAAGQRRSGRHHHLEGADAVADLERFVVTGKAQRPHPPLHPHAAAPAISDLGKAILQKAFRHDGHEFQEKALGPGAEGVQQRHGRRSLCGGGRGARHRPRGGACALSAQG